MTPLNVAIFRHLLSCDTIARGPFGPERHILYRHHLCQDHHPFDSLEIQLTVELHKKNYQYSVHLMKSYAYLESRCILKSRRTISAWTGKRFMGRVA